MNFDLINAMADLEEEIVVSIVEKSVQDGISTEAILADLQEGINIVGERFSRKEYFLPELMLSGKLFKDAQALLVDSGASIPENTMGSIIIGTVKNDIHDIGKNIVVSVFESNRFKVIDLGIDVPPDAFVQAIRETDARLIGMSCLLTTAFASIKETVEAIEAAGLRRDRLLLIGGGPTDRNTQKYTGADFVCSTAQDGVRIAKEFLAGYTIS